jgi:hypothetical protein
VPRFYFHLFDGQPCIDEEGLELANVPAARLAAVDAARSIMGHDIRKGRLPLGASISIADSSGEIIDWITFAEALADGAVQRMAAATGPTSAATGTVETSATAGGSRGIGDERSLPNLLLRPPLGGGVAFAVALLAVVLPTLVRLAVDGAVSGTAFSPYLPFVLLSALLLPSTATIAVVLSSAVVADFLFMEPYFRLAAAADDLFGIAVFLVTSGIAILAVRSVRLLLHEGPRHARLA